MKPFKHLLRLAAIGLLSMTSHAQSFITNGLVAYYPFNGDANDAAGTNHGTIYGGVNLVPDRFGTINSAYRFNGIDGYIEVGNPLGSSPAFLTQTAWVKILARETTPVPVGQLDVIIGKRHATIPSLGSSWPELAIDGQNSGVGVLALDADFYFNPCRGVTPTLTNTWVFLCGVRSNSTFQLYLNGVLENTLTDPIAISSGEPMHLMHCGAFSSYCNGLLDDVRLYNRALSPGEIAQLYAIENAAPVITDQPTNVVVEVGDTTTFSVTATGSFPLGYQWFKDGIDLVNATNSTLTLANVQPKLIGNYTVIVANISGSGSITSRLASLSIPNINSAFWRGLVAYFPFNGDAKDAVGTNHGTIYGGVNLVPDRFGTINSAYRFNGVDGFIEVGSPVGNSPAFLTQTAWVKILARETTPVPVGQLDVIIGKRHATNPSLGSSWPELAIDGLNSGVGVLALDADFYFNPCRGITPTFTNTWVFLCGVRSNGTFQLYLNGKLENTLTDTIAINSGEPMHLMHSGSFATYCNGLLDDVRLYNRALSPGEIAQLYESESPPHAATGYATLASIFVIGVTVLDPGNGYTNAPRVRIIGGGGSGAQAVAVVDHGIVTAINVINAGFGYTNAPAIIVDPPFIPSPILASTRTSSLIFSNLTVGGSYQLQQFQAPYWTNLPASVTATNAVWTTVVPGTARGEDYRLALNPVPWQAFATPQVVNGFVVGATVTDSGSGYTNPPAVRIISNVGSNATAVASITNGFVTRLIITGAGFGYTDMVTIQIDPPPVAGITPTVLPVLLLDLSNLTPYNNYQIQFKSNLDAAWENWNGGLFTATKETASHYFFITEAAGFFRLALVP